MKIKRKTPIKKASAGTPAGNVLQELSYLKPAQQSSLKLQIGELLLFGDREKKLFWPLMEVLLQQYFIGQSKRKIQ